MTDINRLCSNHKVKQLYAFGSVLTNKFTNESDVDLVVDFDPIDISLYADNYFDLKFSLQKILNRPIDLLEEKAIKNPYFRQNLNQQRRLIYGHWNKSLALWYFNAINEIDSFFLDIPKEFSTYQNDVRTRRAVERNIEIIGEAMNRIVQKGSTIELSNSRKIVDTRNRIIHGYDSVSDNIIWTIIVSHLPTLKSEVEKLLNE